MSEEMMLESMAWESDESEDAAESDEAIAEALAEAEESGEDIGEARRRSRRGPPPGRASLRQVRGVNGMVMPGPNGAKRVAFPRTLATATETNRGLASQEIRRRALESRLNRLEARYPVRQKRDSAVSGIVTLAIGGGLTAFSLIKAKEETTAGESLADKWVSNDLAKVATFTSVGQIATSGAKLLVNGRYHRSGLGAAADAFAAAQLLGFTLASIYKAAPKPKAAVVDNDLDFDKALSAGSEGDEIFRKDKRPPEFCVFVLRADSDGNLVAIPR